jgi:hypothetical protein
VTTDELISRLAADLHLVARGAAWRRLAVGVGGGMAASALMMIVWLGPRPDLWTAVATAPFWIKLLYTSAATLCALKATERLARPGCNAAGAAIAALLVVGALGLLAASELAEAQPSGRSALIYGGSSDRCPWLILAMSLPVLAGAFWAVRGLAPTKLAMAGAATGLLSGAAAALVYSFHCTETAVTFLMLW